MEPLVFWQKYITTQLHKHAHNTITNSDKFYMKTLQQTLLHDDLNFSSNKLTLFSSHGVDEVK